MAFCLIGAKPLSETMIDCCQFDTEEEILTSKNIVWIFSLKKSNIKMWCAKWQPAINWELLWSPFYHTEAKNKMAVILQKFETWFGLKVVFWFQYHWILFSRVLSRICLYCHVAFFYRRSQAISTCNIEFHLTWAVVAVNFLRVTEAIFSGALNWAAAHVLLRLP